MAEPRRLLIDADGPPEGKFRRIFDLLAEMGLRYCAHCGVWKAADHFPVLTYLRDGSAVQDRACRACTGASVNAGTSTRP